jgi:hypothetical protein
MIRTIATYLLLAGVGFALTWLILMARAEPPAPVSPSPEARIAPTSPLLRSLPAAGDTVALDYTIHTLQHESRALLSLPPDQRRVILWVNQSYCEACYGRFLPAVAEFTQARPVLSLLKTDNPALLIALHQAGKLYGQACRVAPTDATSFTYGATHDIVLLRLLRGNLYEAYAVDKSQQAAAVAWLRQVGA